MAVPHHWGWQDINLQQISQWDAFCDSWKALKSIFGWHIALYPAGRAHNAHLGPLVGWRGGKLSPFSTPSSPTASQHLQCLEPLPLPNLHPQAVPSGSTSVCSWLFHYFLLGLWLPTQPQSITASNNRGKWVHVNNLPRIIVWQWNSQELNPQSLDHESDNISTFLISCPAFVLYFQRLILLLLILLKFKLTVLKHRNMQKLFRETHLEPGFDDAAKSASLFFRQVSFLDKLLPRLDRLVTLS